MLSIWNNLIRTKLETKFLVFGCSGIFKNTHVYAQMKCILWDTWRIEVHVSYHVQYYSFVCFLMLKYSFSVWRNVGWKELETKVDLIWYVESFSRSHTHMRSIQMHCISSAWQCMHVSDQCGAYESNIYTIFNAQMNLQKITRCIGEQSLEQNCFSTNLTDSSG